MMGGSVLDDTDLPPTSQSHRTPEPGTEKRLTCIINIHEIQFLGHNIRTDFVRYQELSDRADWVFTLGFGPW